MKLVRFEREGQVRIGVEVDGGAAPTDFRDILEVAAAGEQGLAKAEACVRAGEIITDYRALAPIQNPGKILCSGINYTSHKDENPDAVFPEEPSVFSKLPSSIIGPEDPIIIPNQACQVDYEVELAFIIGKVAKHVSKAEALDYVFGYTVINDVSERALQFTLQHETIGKGADTFCPMGPYVALKDEIPDPSSLRVAGYVNGETRQSSPTSDMLFDVPTLIQKLTAYITLYPGDVISTGTPAGCGTFRNPPQFLKPGDRVVVEVDKIGKLSNPVVAGW